MEEEELKASEKSCWSVVSDKRTPSAREDERRAWRGLGGDD
jgi:hypothetical protein